MGIFRYTSRLAVITALLLLVSCGSKNEDTTSDTAQPQEDAATSGTTQYSSNDAKPETLMAQEPTPPPAKKPEPKVEKKLQPKKPEPPPQPKTATVPAGAALTVSLITNLRTDSNHIGDLFGATVDEPLMVDDKVVIPAGTQLQGRLVKVEEPHRTKGRAQMTLLFDQLQVPDGSQDIVTVPIELQGDPEAISDEGKVAAGGVIGSVIGALASKKKTKGAAVGAAVGAAAGGAIAVATKGKQIELGTGQKLNVEFAEPVEVQLPKTP